MTQFRITRRDILLGSSLAAMNTFASYEHRHPSVLPPKDFRYFSREDAADVESIAALIIPTDQTPGAREAGVIRTHTIMGFFGNPAWQGNRDEIGWKLIGFEDKFAFRPPFGHYDAGVDTA